MAEWRKMDEDEVKYYKEFQKKLKDVIDGKECCKTDGSSGDG